MTYNVSVTLFKVNTVTRTTMGTGYTKAKEFHDEGDIWEEDGTSAWTIKNGIKQNITKLDKAKEGIVLPLFCPSCSKSTETSLR